MRRHAKAATAGSNNHRAGKLAHPVLSLAALVALLVVVLGAGSADGAASCPNQAFRVGPSAALPDCRAYEMVSPVDKDNNDVIIQANLNNFPARLDQSAVAGDAFTFSAKNAFPGALAGTYSNQYFSRRTSSGWSTEGISPPQTGFEVLNASFNSGVDSPFKAFSPDLGTSWIAPSFEPNLDPSVPGGFVNIFRHEAGSYEAQIRSLPPYPGFELSHYPELQGVSADGLHAVFRTAENLTPEAPDLGETNTQQLYEAHREGGGPSQLRLVSILPNGSPATTGASAGTANVNENFRLGRVDQVTNAISDDGSRIYWTASNVGPGKIFVRVDGKETLPVSEAGESTDSSNARFWAASADGSKALFVFTEGPNSGELYEYSIASEKATPIAGEVSGVVGQSEDLSHVYFVSEEALATGGTAGQFNLYLDNGGMFSFVAKLGVEDIAEFSSPERIYTPVEPRPFFHAATASADGSALAFMSYSKELAEEVAGYDNTDQNTGVTDGEVYRYDAHTGKLSCVSCNPSGARPVGHLILLGGTKKTPASPLAAGLLPNPDNELYLRRYLSTDGQRLFFNSFDALLPHDTNGVMDVYEWEAPGSGDCTEASSSFIAKSGGCLYLISTGESPTESEFLDATPDGSDVFFTTLSSLVPQDPNLIDVYDARVGGGYPTPPPSPAACEGEACQGPSPNRTDPTPASANYRGPGNAKAPTAARCAKRKVSRRGRCVARRKKHHAKHHHKRAHQRANDDRGGHR